MVDKYKNEILNRVIHKSNYEISDYSNKSGLSLKNIVVCFYNGIHWNVIDMNVMLSYPILYFDFYSLKYEKYFTNSLLVCPLTLRSIIYKGHIKIVDIINDNLKLKNLDTGDEFMMDSPFTGSHDKDGKEKSIKSQIKRYQVIISNLRDIFSMTSDPKYINVNNKIDKILGNKYYCNKVDIDNNNINTLYHPKTLSYIIQYHENNKYNYLVIPPSNINSEKKSGYKYKKSDFLNFFKENEEKHKELKAYIYPILWFYIPKLYDNVTIIK
jgi:hypothetical protein